MLSKNGIVDFYAPAAVGWRTLSFSAIIDSLAIETEILATQHSSYRSWARKVLCMIYGKRLND